MGKISKAAISFLITAIYIINSVNSGFAIEQPKLRPAIAPPTATAPVPQKSLPALRRPKINPPKVTSVPVKSSIPIKQTPLSLSNFIRQYNGAYVDTLTSTIAALAMANIAVTSFNTEEGKIKARMKNGKELFILIATTQPNTTQVRITPADGVYNIAPDAINALFAGIKTEVAKY